MTSSFRAWPMITTCNMSHSLSDVAYYQLAYFDATMRHATCYHRQLVLEPQAARQTAQKYARKSPCHRESNELAHCAELLAGAFHVAPLPSRSKQPIGCLGQHGDRPRGIKVVRERRRELVAQ